MTLLVLDQRRFNGLLDAVPALSHKLLVAMSTRIREADAKAAASTSGAPSGRRAPPTLQRLLHDLAEVQDPDVVLALRGPSRRRRA